MKDYIQMFIFILFGIGIAAGMGIVGKIFGNIAETIFFFVTMALYLYCLIKVVQNYEKKRAKNAKKAS